MNNSEEKLRQESIRLYHKIYPLVIISRELARSSQWCPDGFHNIKELFIIILNLSCICLKAICKRCVDTLCYLERETI